MKKKVFAVILAAAAICGSLSPVYAADSELVLYTWEGMFPQEVLDGFEEETGCKIVYSNFDTDETMLEKVSMAKGGDYDVVIADDYILEKIVEEGLATKLDKDKISNWGNINPLYQGQFYDEKDEYTVPYGAGIPLIVYDPEEVDLDIKGYSDLWDPSLEDSIALIGNYRVINGITLLTMGKNMNEEDVDTIAEAGEKLVELAPNVRMIQDDNTQNALLNGEASSVPLHLPGNCSSGREPGSEGGLSGGRSWLRCYGNVYSKRGSKCRCSLPVCRLYFKTGGCCTVLQLYRLLLHQQGSRRAGRREPGGSGQCNKWREY